MHAALRDNPDFMLEQEEEAASHARERHEDKPVAHWVPPVRAWSAALVISLGAYFGFQALTAKTTYAATSARFVETFHQGDLERITAFFQPSTKTAKQFAEYAEHRGWIEAGWPQLVESNVLERIDSAYVTYAGAKDPMIAVWQRAGEEWKLGGFGKKSETLEALEEAILEHARSWRDKYRELSEVNANFLRLLGAGDEAGLAEHVFWPAFGDPVQEIAQELSWAQEGWPALRVIGTREPPISLFGGEVMAGARVEVEYTGADVPLKAMWIRTAKGWGLMSFGKPVPPQAY